MRLVTFTVDFCSGYFIYTDKLHVHFCDRFIRTQCSVYMLICFFDATERTACILVNKHDASLQNTGMQFMYALTEVLGPSICMEGCLNDVEKTKLTDSVYLILAAATTSLWKWTLMAAESAKSSTSATDDDKKPRQQSEPRSCCRNSYTSRGQSPSLVRMRHLWSNVRQKAQLPNA